MPTQYCFLCASDEGVLLDITTENIQTFRTQFEICSLVTVPIPNKSQTKVCHKCVYELNQCSTFLQKYKQITKQRSQNRKPCCSLCFRLTKKEYLFDLSKENSLQLRSIEKIQQVLNNEIDKIQGDNILVCLSCRYTVDVLYDLKNLSNEIGSILDKTTEKDIDYSRFPKVKTTVVNRKTTITESAKVTLKPRENTTSDSDMMKSTRSKAKVHDNRVNNKVIVISDEEEFCVECHNPVKANSGSHANEKTGESVCNDCWESSRLNAKDVDVQQSSTETKVCKVFLKDVLGQTATQKGKKMIKVNKDDRNKTKSNPKAMSREYKESLKNTGIDSIKMAEKRPSKLIDIHSVDNNAVPNKRRKRGVKGSLSDQEINISSRVTRKRKGTGQSFDSDYPINNDNVKESKGSLIKHMKVTGTSLSGTNIATKTDRKRLKSILAENNASRNTSTIDELPVDDGALKKKKLRFTNDPLVTIDLTNIPDESERPKRNMAKRTAGRAEKIVKSVLTKKPSEKTESMESEARGSPDEEENKTYSCEECGVHYENKVVFLTHKLSHCKQPKLELQKLDVESKLKETLRATSEAVDETSEDQSEGVKITVDDDEEEAELEASNLESNVETSLGTSSRVEQIICSPREEEPKATTVDTEVVSKGSDNDQLTEESGKDRKSRASRSRSGSADNSNGENISEQVEEEDVEDISLTNLEDEQEEGEEEKEVCQSTEKEETEENEKEAESKNMIADAVDEAEGGVVEPNETISDEKSEEDVHKDVGVDKLDSSKKIEANVNQEDDKPKKDESDEKDERNEKDDSNGKDERNEKDDTESSDKLEKNPVERKDLSTSDMAEEKIEDGDDDDNNDNKTMERADESEKHDIEKETADSTDKPVEGKVTGSPSRKSPRKSRSSNLGKNEENKQDNSESLMEKNKTDSPSSNLSKSPERRSTRKSKTVLLSKSDENKKSEEGKDKATTDSSGKSPERKSPRRSKSVLFAKIEENKTNSAEKHEKKDKSGSPGNPEEKKTTRKSKSVSFTMSEGKNKQDSFEKPEEESESIEKLEDKRDFLEKLGGKPDSSEKLEDKSDSSEKPEDKSDFSEKLEEKGGDEGDKIEVVVEMNENSSNDVLKVCEKVSDNRPSVHSAEQVLDLNSSDENSCEVMEVSEKKSEEEVECVEETSLIDGLNKKTSNGAEENSQNIVTVPISDSAGVAAEILQEVFDLASAEIQKRQDVAEVVDGNDSDDAETLENISREVQNGGDLKSRESNVSF